MLSAKKLVNDPQVSIFVAESVSAAVSFRALFRRRVPTISSVEGHCWRSSVRLVESTPNRGGKVLVVRGSETPEQETLEIDASPLIDEGDVTQNIGLKPGDIVVVPVARALREST